MRAPTSARRVCMYEQYPLRPGPGAVRSVAGAFVQAVTPTPPTPTVATWLAS